jgi:iron complex transport system substrate-binding protein
MRIVSLLPSATESLFALGLGSSLVAVTHECDYPPEATSLPIVTRSTLRLHDRDSAGIEVAVSGAAVAGRSLYLVDTQAIQELEPDLVIAQDVCRVCAVSADQVAADLEGIRMIRQHPHSLHDVLADIVALASACGADAEPLMRRLNVRIDAAAQTVHRHRPVRGVFLEWLDPPYPAGHWTPDLLALAGIEDPLARPGAPSVAMSWADVVEARPELLVLAPCGFDQKRAQAEADLVRADIESVGASHVVVLDGSAYFNRPGPRLVDSLELLVANRQLASPRSGEVN